MERGICKIEGCGKPHKAAGYCPGHYARWRRGATPDSPLQARGVARGTACSVEGCTSDVVARGLCKVHYQRTLRHGHVKATRKAAPQKRCAVPGCTDWHYAGGWCSRHYQRDAKMKRDHGVGIARYLEIWAQQDGRCALCGKAESGVLDHRRGTEQDMPLDHDHRTGRIRAILCHNCNRGIGLLCDDPALLRQAAAYVERGGP